MSTSAADLRWWDYIALVREAFPGYIESLTAEQRDRLQNLARRAAAEDWRPRQFRQAVQDLRSFRAWQTGGEEPPTTEEPPAEEAPEDIDLPGFPGFTPSPAPEDDQDDVRNLLLRFLQENELPTTLMGFIESALAENKPFAQIVAELRQTPEYLAVYGVNQQRLEQGFRWMPEAEIRAYRSEARRLAEAYLGIQVSQDEIDQLLARDKSLAEWERLLQTWKEFERWGPVVRAVFEEELGYRISDDRVFAFLAPFIPTPELDRAWEKALLRARPAVLGLGIRPDEEAEILRRYGISPEQAFRGYQGIVAELPRAERLAAIEAEINRNVERFPPATQLFADTPFALLFRAIQLGDPEAISALQQQMAREVARFQAGGGPAGGGVGLLSEEERAWMRATGV